MITGVVCFVGGLFLQKFYPVIGDVIVSSVQRGWAKLVTLKDRYTKG